MNKKIRLLAILFVFVLGLAGCSGGTGGSSEQQVEEQPQEQVSAEVPEEEPADEKEPVTILVAAAASLEYAYVEQLIPMFQDKYPWITVKGTYDSSGKLQTQIEEGMEADIFMSAAMKQMNALKDQGLMDDSTIVELLENKIVLICPVDSNPPVTGFADITAAETIALGDPDSVPAGQYAKEAFESLGIWEEVSAKTSFGTNVTEVLNWVVAGSADVGVVYATDAATTDQVSVIAEAPEGSLAQKVIYPVGLVADSAHPEEARLFLDFLCSDEALAVFVSYGFSPNE